MIRSWKYDLDQDLLSPPNTCNSATAQVRKLFSYCQGSFRPQVVQFNKKFNIDTPIDQPHNFVDPLLVDREIKIAVMERSRREKVKAHLNLTKTNPRAICSKCLYIINFRVFCRIGLGILYNCNGIAKWGTTLRWMLYVALCHPSNLP